MTAALILAFAFSAPAPKATSTADWPQWRGPNRDGKSAETGLVIPKDGPKLLYKLDDVGIGYGAPAVVGNRLYLIGNKTDAPEMLLCLDLDSGKEIWKAETSAKQFSNGWGGGPRSTPTVADGHVFTISPNGDLNCFTTEGKKVWGKSLVRDFGGKVPQWGYSESPLVDDGRVHVTPGVENAIVALDAKTGKTIWALKDVKAGDNNAYPAYSSLMPMTIGGKKIYVTQMMATGQKATMPEGSIGVFADTGKLAFQTGEIPRSTAPIPTPAISGDYIFVTAGYGAGCECYQLTLDGDRVKPKKIFANKKSMQNHHGGVIIVGDHVYGHSNSGWTCLAYKTPEADVVWQNDKFKKGSITYADGHFFCYQESDGTVAVIKADPKGWNEVARFTIPETSKKRPNSGKVWPHPVIAQGKLILRDFEKLFVYDLKAN